MNCGLKSIQIYFICIIHVYFISIFGHVDCKQCKQYFALQPKTLIATKKSEDNGAVFIKSQSTASVDECYSLCCSVASCTVAVYENKDKRMCYMFNCWTPNVCTFVKDVYYATLVASDEPQPDQSTVVNETTVIHHKADIKQSSEKSTIAAKLKNLPPALLGESCGVNRQCHVKNAICANGNCLCDSGFIEKKSRCVTSVCSKPDLMFQCEDTSKSPACIAIYDRCNGISECGDSSDELGCDSDAKKSKTSDTSVSKSIAVSKPNIKMNSMGGIPRRGQINVDVSQASNNKQSNQPGDKTNPTGNRPVYPPSEKPLNRVRPYPGDNPSSKHSSEETRPLNRVRPYPDPQPQPPRRRPLPPMRNSQNSAVGPGSPAEKQLVQSHAPDKGKAPIQDLLDREYGVMKGDSSLRDHGRMPLNDMRQGNSPSSQQRLDLWQQQQPQSDYDSLSDPSSDSRWASGGPVISMPNNNRLGDYYFSGRDRYKPAEDEDWYNQDSYNNNKAAQYGHGGDSWLSSNRLYPNNDFDDLSLYQNYKGKDKYAPSKLTEHAMQHKKPKDENYLHGKLVSEDKESESKLAKPEQQSSPKSASKEAEETKNSDALSTDKSLLAILPSDLKMLEQSNSQSRLAIVLLTIGLSVTIILVAVTCWRVRTIKRRFRRSGGKSLATDEAEHLMNGMYL